jgi:hypothetical protein
MARLENHVYSGGGIHLLLNPRVVDQEDIYVDGDIAP